MGNKKYAISSLVIGVYKLTPQGETTTHSLEYLKFKGLTSCLCNFLVDDVEQLELSFIAGGNVKMGELCSKTNFL